MTSLSLSLAALSPSTSAMGAPSFREGSGERALFAMRTDRGRVHVIGTRA